MQPKRLPFSFLVGFHEQQNGLDAGAEILRSGDIVCGGFFSVVQK